MLTEKSKRQNRKGESRNAAPRGGTTRSSGEVPDKGMERRGRVDGVKFMGQPERGGAEEGARTAALTRLAVAIDGSCMNREVHVQF